MVRKYQEVHTYVCECGELYATEEPKCPGCIDLDKPLSELIAERKKD